MSLLLTSASKRKRDRSPALREASWRRSAIASSGDLPATTVRGVGRSGWVYACSPSTGAVSLWSACASPPPSCDARHKSTRAPRRGTTAAATIDHGVRLAHRSRCLMVSSPLLTGESHGTHGDCFRHRPRKPLGCLARRTPLGVRAGVQLFTYPGCRRREQVAVVPAQAQSRRA